MLRSPEDEDADLEFGPILYKASTPGVKRDGLDMAVLPWNVDRYRTNPVVTWAHDFKGTRLPIGRADVDIEQTDEGELIWAKVYYDRDDPFAAEVDRKTRIGILNNVSVSWDDTDADGIPSTVSGKKPIAHDLLEIAAVPVPGDPDALAERQRAALRELGWTLMELGQPQDGPQRPTRACGCDTAIAPCTCNGATGRDDWTSVSAKMVATLDPRSGDPEDVRRRKYQALLPAYRRLGKVAPMWVPPDDLELLDGDTWRGLFLEGEVPCARVGAVLNTRNKDKLRQAATLIGEVLDSAGDNDKPTEDTPEAETKPEPERAEVDPATRFLLDVLKTLEV